MANLLTAAPICSILAAELIRGFIIDTLPPVLDNFLFVCNSFRVVESGVSWVGLVICHRDGKECETRSSNMRRGDARRTGLVDWLAGFQMVWPGYIGTGRINLVVLP